MVNLSELEIALSKVEILFSVMFLGLIALLVIMLICDGILRCLDL